MKQFVLALLLMISWWSAQTITITSAPIVVETNQVQQGVTLREFLVLYFSYFGQDLPASYTNIALSFTNVAHDKLLVDALKKGIYMDMLPNQSWSLPNLYQLVPEQLLAEFLSRHFRVTIDFEPKKLLTQQKIQSELTKLPTFFSSKKSNNSDALKKQSSPSVLWYPEMTIFADVLSKLQTDFYEADKVNVKELLYGAIKGLTNSAGDDYTVFFPPQETKNFMEELHWQFEWIGAYIEMSKPGQLTIISPIVNSPAERAGLRWWDIILKVDDFVIDETVSLTNAVSRIKWPAKTQVKLTIKRGDQIIVVPIVRDAIVITFVEHKSLSPQHYYIKIAMFGDNVSTEFDKAMQAFKTSNATKLILDVRNNPGWSLMEVVKMLGYFIPQGKPAVTIKTRFREESMNAQGAPFTISPQTTVTILINEWSASASEILAWTIKDYHLATTLIGQKTFGKWSVQMLDQYDDGSSIKYTVARRYTGKSQTAIDRVGIMPDLVIASTGSQDLALQAALQR